MRCGAYQQASDRKTPSHIKLLPAQHVAPACRPGGCIAKLRHAAKHMHSAMGTCAASPSDLTRHRTSTGAELPVEAQQETGPVKLMRSCPPGCRGWGSSPRTERRRCG